MEDRKAALAAALDPVIGGISTIPGVVAMVTDRFQNLYEGAAGERLFGAGAEMTADTVFALYSATKAITGTALLQCVEEGKVDLDAPARIYVPEIGTLQVIEGFDGEGNPRLRPPRSEITPRMLMLHTAGFGYDFFNAVYRRLAQERGQPGVQTASKAALMTPLLFDPGTRWEYGSSIDWAGQIVEAVRGRRLGEVMEERIFQPLGISDMAFAPTQAMRDRLAMLHSRRSDGSLKPLHTRPPEKPEIHMGGHGLYGSVGEYMKFIRMWLNDGAGPNGQVLRKETVEMAVKNGLREDQRVTMLTGVNPSLSRDFELFPGLRKSWAYTFMVNDDDAPTGRPAGSLGWAGLANLYYWIDRHNGIGGFWATQLFPFADPAPLRGYLDFEAATYRALVSRGAS